MDDDGQPRIQALINLHFFFLGREPRGDVAATGVAAQSVELFSQLNVPVIKPVVAYSQDISQWEENPQGLFAEVTFGIAMPNSRATSNPLSWRQAARCPMKKPIRCSRFAKPLPSAWSAWPTVW